MRQQASNLLQAFISAIFALHPKDKTTVLHGYIIFSMVYNSFHSQLLKNSSLVYFPPLIDMLKFRGLSFQTQVINTCMIDFRYI